MVQTSKSSSRVPRPPGSVMNASDLSIMRFLREPMSSVTISSSDAGVGDLQVDQRLRDDPEGVRRRPARAPSATAPIMPTLPPPETRVCPRRGQLRAGLGGQVEPSLLETCWTRRRRRRSPPRHSVRPVSRRHRGDRPSRAARPTMCRTASSTSSVSRIRSRSAGTDLAVGEQRCRASSRAARPSTRCPSGPPGSG